ncbi:MAG: hypothetical protein ABIP35_15630 [Ginsengibacter sp.]
MDNFKKDIREKRELLDTDIPSNVVWERISVNKTLTKGKTISLFYKWAVAASVIGLIMFSVIFLSQNHDNNSVPNEIAAVKIPSEKPHSKPIQPIQTPTENITTLSSSEKNEIVFKQKPDKKVKSSIEKKHSRKINPEQLLVQDLQNNYAQLVNMQVDLINKTPVYAASPGYFQSFKDHFRSLDSSEIVLRKTIKNYGLNGELLEQLINLNQSKLNVLKSLQSEVNKINNKVAGTAGPDSISSYFIDIKKSM